MPLCYVVSTHWSRGQNGGGGVLMLARPMSGTIYFSQTTPNWEQRDTRSSSKVTRLLDERSTVCCNRYLRSRARAMNGLGRGNRFLPHRHQVHAFFALSLFRMCVLTSSLCFPVLIRQLNLCEVETSDEGFRDCRDGTRPRSRLRKSAPRYIKLLRPRIYAIHQEVGKPTIFAGGGGTVQSKAVGYDTTYERGIDYKANQGSW